MPHAANVNRFFKVTGFTACLLTVLMTAGGHWLALQSIAWACMIVDYARQDPLSAAVAKTFDGRHPCPMCLKICEGRQQEQQDGKKLPGWQPEKMPELFCEVRSVTVPLAPTASVEAEPFVPRLHPDFIASPLTPPPRAATAAL